MRFTMNATDEIIRERGLNRGGRVQKYIDSECIRRMAKYTPKNTGTLIRSATLHTTVGSGEIRQKTPYAKSQYYYNSGNGRQGTNRGGERGRLWFERMKTAHRDEILRGAAGLAGAKTRQGG